jgi:hypothetical protein
VLEGSTWVKAENRMPILSAGMPMPVSWMDVHFPLVGELDRVPGEVHDDLPDPAGVTVQGGGHVGLDDE